MSLQNAGGTLPVNTGMSGALPLPSSLDWKTASATISTGKTIGLRYAPGACRAFCVVGISTMGSIFKSTDSTGIAKQPSTMSTLAEARP